MAKLVTRVAQPSPDRAIVDGNGAQSEQMKYWTRVITNQALIIGTGNPEGVVESVQGGMYMDDIGTAGNILYVKRDADIGGDITQGWVLV